jgi:pimeloyl-ACP methyl ester carboxylesterase
MNAIEKLPTDPQRGCLLPRPDSRTRGRPRVCSSTRRLLVALVAAVGLLSGCPAFQKGKARYPAPDERFIEVGGRRIHFVDEAAGPKKPTIVFIHGFASSWVVWSQLMSALKEEYRVVALDLPGFGYSDKKPGDYSPQALADLVARFMEARSIPRAHVVAHSWGCSVALALALRHRARVQTLSLLGAWVFEEQIVPFMKWSRVKWLGELLFALFYTERVGDRFAAAFHDPRRYADHATTRKIQKALERPGAVRAALQAVRDMRFEKLQARYRRVQAPTLLIWGRQDHVSKLRFAHRLHKTLPNAWLFSLELCGHFPMIERYDVTLRRLRKHLSRFRLEHPPEARDRVGGREQGRSRATKTGDTTETEEATEPEEATETGEATEAKEASSGRGGAR